MNGRKYIQMHQPMLQITESQFEELNNNRKALVDVRALILKAKTQDTDFEEWYDYLLNLSNVPDALKRLLDEKAGE